VPYFASIGYHTGMTDINALIAALPKAENFTSTSKVRWSRNS